MSISKLAFTELASYISSAETTFNWDYMIILS